MTHGHSLAPLTPINSAYMCSASQSQDSLSQTFTGIQDNPTLMTTHILSHFTDTYALGIFVISHMIRYHLHLSHLDEYFKTL